MVRCTSMGMLDGRVAIITGGTSGIGESSSEYFAEHGATVIIAGRSAETGEAIADRLGEKVFYRQTDVTIESDINDLVSWTAGRFGRIDCLFNNAGASTPSGNVEDLSADRIRQGMDLLVTSVFLATKAVVPHMKRQMGGSIINNASVAGSGTGYAGLVYSTAKGAVIHLTRCVAAQLAPYRIRVNSVSPGIIVTPIFALGYGLTTSAAIGAEDTVRDWGARITPLGRAGEPEDIAGAALFLASDLSSFMTGHDLVVDGGLTTGWRIEESNRIYGELAESLKTVSE
jgi:NAD(P)-dependent dehydrogenase (short-subunit alcohol dehydrogenase family)